MKSQNDATCRFTTMEVKTKENIWIFVDKRVEKGEGGKKWLALIDRHSDVLRLKSSGCAYAVCAATHALLNTRRPRELIAATHTESVPSQPGVCAWNCRRGQWAAEWDRFQGHNAEGWADQPVLHFDVPSSSTMTSPRDRVIPRNIRAFFNLSFSAAKRLACAMFRPFWSLACSFHFSIVGIELRKSCFLVGSLLNHYWRNSISLVDNNNRISGRMIFVPFSKFRHYTRGIRGKNESNLQARNGGKSVENRKQIERVRLSTPVSL